MEETHYYPFGLTMAGISSKAAGTLENKRKYNGIEFDEDLGLNTHEAFYRDLDVQTGIWWQIDPEYEKMEMWSPYVSNYNNPLRYSDPLGNEPDEEQCCAGLLKLGKIIYRIASITEKLSELKKITLDDIVESFSIITIDKSSIKGNSLIITDDQSNKMVLKSGQVTKTESQEVKEKDGGGKNAQHANQKARDAAKEKYDTYKKELDQIKSKPNKTKEDKEQIQKMEKKVKHEKQKMDNTGENHSRKAKGN